MVLRCKCNGAVELQRAHESDSKNFTEHYECVDCSGVGMLRVTNGKQELTGCLTSA